MATGDFGLRPIKAVGGRPYSGGRNAYPVSNGYATDLYCGDPVKLSAGYVVLAGNGDKVKGVFLGASYIDALGAPILSERLPASTSIAAPPIDAFNGNSNPVAYVADDPGLVMVIRADSSVSVGHLGLNFRVSAGTGNNATKRSGANLKVASAITSGVDATSADKQTMVRLLGVYNVPGNSIGSATPLLEVQWVAHADMFTNA